MKVGGKLLTIDISGSSKIRQLTNSERLIPLVKRWIEKTGAQIVKIVDYHFDNGSYSVVFLLKESHFSIHTFVEDRGISIDFYTCGDINPFEISNNIVKYFGGKSKVRKIIRGIDG
jgi:S-adenosylmethionine/arginine decarboxylase-like enzyme